MITGGAGLSRLRRGVVKGLNTGKAAGKSRFGARAGGTMPAKCAAWIEFAAAFS